MDRPTYEVVDDAALCYDHLLGDLIYYYIALDKVCVDLMVTGKTLEELAVDTTVSEILSDTDTYHAEYVELEAFVIAINDEGMVIADVNNDLANDSGLLSLSDGTDYTGAVLSRGTVNCKFLTSSPSLLNALVNGV